MPLNNSQQKLVEDNMGLVGTVIKENVRNIRGIGLFTYEDIFQIGCLGLSKAAEKYTPGDARFCTCAYVYIRNEIFNALDYATVRRRNEAVVDVEDVLGMMPPDAALDAAASDLDRLLDSARARATGVAAKGIDALRMMAEGYTCREIGVLMGGASANNVTAWVSKARALLKDDPAIAALKDSL